MIISAPARFLTVALTHGDVLGAVLSDPELRAKYDLLYLSALNAEVRIMP